MVVMKKFQLVGKVTGENRVKTLQKFSDAAHLTKVKYPAKEVINPMDLCRVRWSWFRCMVVCLYNLIFKADAIALLPDWCNSKGARIEVLTAIILHKKIVLL
jgi:hypothetical protein